jgi:hypothetical protein
MKIIGLLLVGVLLVAAVAMVWQHMRYLKLRRDVVQDRQPLLYGSETFHVVTYLQLPEGTDVIEPVRKLRETIESAPDAQLIYAGKAVVNGLTSAQLGEVRWSAVVVVQYPSREAYDAIASAEPYRQALAAFDRTYSHGMDRGVLFNLLLPQLFLAMRTRQIVTRQPSHFPFVPDPNVNPEQAQRLKALEAESELGADAVVVVNLLKEGTPEQRAASNAYGLRMFGMMAEGGMGPMHFARAVPIEGEARFDRVAIVFYPGVEYMTSMLGSTFFQGIVGGKQPSDTQATITVPILSRL